MNKITTMNYNELMNLVRKTTIGGDSLFSIASQTIDNYPPYNIESNVIALDESGSTKEQYVLSFAVAGFSKDELNVSIISDRLIIEGKKKEKIQDAFIKEGTIVDTIVNHRGISTKPFKKEFKVAENLILSSAETIDGLLVITFDVDKSKTEPKKILIK